MGHLGKRKPHQLSGGQQQRVAVARALVLEPIVLLLDEPMGALDAKLRKQLQIELRSLQRIVGTTFVYVTHDQEEALTMSDRLAVLHHGRVMQVGTPSEVYSQPASAHVATFLGTTNLYDAVVSAVGPEGLTCRVGETVLTAGKSEYDARVGEAVGLMVRPERVEVSPQPTSGEPPVTLAETNLLSGKVTTLTFRGAHTAVLVDVGGFTLEAEARTSTASRLRGTDRRSGELAPVQWVARSRRVMARSGHGGCDCRGEVSGRAGHRLSTKETSMRSVIVRALAGRRRVLVIALAMMLLPSLAVSSGAIAAGTDAKRTTVEVYDSFAKTGGYTMADYQAKWTNDPYGLGEMALGDTRSFKGNAFNISAVPFRTAYDFSVYDHLKYIAISKKAFPVPTNGSVEFSSTIKAATPGTQPGRVIHGTYVDSGLPYAEPTLEGQQAGAVMNMVDFRTGQLFDWFVSGHSAFALIERLPSSVTGNTSDPSSPEYVGRDKMYTQIIKEIPSSPGAHQVSIRFSRSASGGSVDYFFDGSLVAHVDHVGIPLDQQGVPFTGIYPSLGAGEELASKVDSLVIGHGLFSLLDAFPFQHPDVPELAVSIPLSERIFGQGAAANFDDFRVKTVSR